MFKESGDRFLGFIVPTVNNENFISVFPPIVLSNERSQFLIFILPIFPYFLAH